MKLAIGSANRDGGDLKWFRKHSSLTLGQLKERLSNGQPVTEWSPYPESMEDEDVPFERIKSLLDDAKENGIKLSFFEFDVADDLINLPSGWKDQQVTEEQARNLIESWRHTRDNVYDDND